MVLLEFFLIHGCVIKFKTDMIYGEINIGHFPGAVVSVRAISSSEMLHSEVT